MGKRIEFDDLAVLGDELRRAGKRIVLTNGHFDLLHVGHLRSLQAARRLGDVLVVAVNDDASTRRRKGPARPFVPAEERAELLAGLACVDYVTVFPDDTAERVIQLLRPHVYVKGGDYGVTPEELASGKQPLPEAELVRALGGEVVLIPYVPERSTTELVRRILAAYGCAEVRDRLPSREEAEEGDLSNQTWAQAYGSALCIGLCTELASSGRSLPRDCWPAPVLAMPGISRSTAHP